MKVVTYATDVTDGVQLFLASCARYGIEPTVLGSGQPFTGHGMKIVLLRAYLNGIDATETVLYTDAYDVLFLRDPSDLEDTFRSFDRPVVFSTEGYFKFIDFSKAWYWLNYPKGRKPFAIGRYLNAGCFIGKAGPLLRVFEQLPVEETTECDQTVLSKHFIAHPEDLTLDYGQRIFATTSAREGFEIGDFSIADDRLRQNLTGTYPYVLHFPGRNRVGLDLVSRQLGYQGVPVLEEDRVRYRRDHRNNRFAFALGIDQYGRHLVEATAKLGLILLVLSAVAWFLGVP